MRPELIDSASRPLPSPLADGKLFPPRLAPGLHLRRSRLLRQVRDQGGAGKKTVLIEAQAGQGKSIFAAQLVEDFGADFCWYQLGAEDGDTLLLVSSLLTGLSAQLPGFRAPLLERILGSGAVTAHDYPRLCALLLDELKSFLRHDFYLVLDDVYRLDGFAESLAFIRGLLDGAPPRLRFILTSRHPIAPVVRALLPAGDSLIVDNAVLAFNRRETAELFNGILHIPVSRHSVRLLHRITEGWPLGLILAGQSLPEGAAGSDETLDSELLTISRGGVLDYFLAQVFPRFSAGLQRSLLILSLLDSMPVALAETLGEVPDPAGLLPGLHRQNFFIRPLDDGRSEYVFHHLFHETLRSLARQRLSPDEIREVHRRAAAWYLRHGRPVAALGHYFSAGEYVAADAVLKEVGFELQANNRIITLHQTLRRIPAEVIRHHGWLSFFAGITAMDVDPPQALASFENARSRFIEENDASGALLALIQILAFHVIVDGRYQLGALHLERAAQLFAQRSAELPALQRARAANVLLMAFTIIRTDIRRADTYFDLGLGIARELRLKNLEAEARMWRCFRHIFAGTLPDILPEIEQAYPLLQSPLVAPMNQGAIYTAMVNALSNLGEHDTFAYHRHRLRQLLGEELVDQSVVGAFLMLWEIDLALARGDDEGAREVLTRALAPDFAGGGTHLRSQYLQYAALLLVQEGKGEEALAALDESRRLRDEIGSPYFLAIHCLFAGAVLARLRRPPAALEYFRQGLEIAERIGEWYNRAGLHAYRARLLLELERTAEALADIGDCLDLLHRLRLEHFYGWTPELMASILTVAVREKIRPDFARQLAARRLDLGILADGTAIPLLRIRSLGTLEITLGERPVLTGGELPPAQRQLLAILLASAGLQRSQGEIAALLWPDSPEEKARKNFDALLIRLRRTIQDSAPGEIDSRNYLPLRKGILALEHCRVDAQDYRDGAAKALRHLRRGENWQADNAFRAAFGLWQGEFLAGMPLPEPAETFRTDLIALYLESACHWSRLLAADGRHEEAVKVAAAALHHDPVHEELVRILYGIHTAQSQPVRARKVLEDYAAALRAEEFSEDEIDEILEAFWTRPA